MINFLMGKGYWEYVEGEHDESPELPAVENAMKALKMKARKVMYGL